MHNNNHTLEQLWHILFNPLCLILRGLCLNETQTDVSAFKDCGERAI
jgi:hypothetical protein